MAEITIEEVRDYLKPIQGRETDLGAIRKDFNLLPGSKSWEGVRTMMFRLARERVVKPSGRNDGRYKVLLRVEPVSVFSKNHNKAPFELFFPRDYDTGMEMGFAEHVILRSGDLVLISGASNYGKTTLALNFLAENVAKHPCVIMGNEYTTVDGEAMPRFVNRLETMDWVEWVNEDGSDKFTLLPVREDYAEYVQKDKVNIIDWINVETGEHYMIGNILESIKRNVGKGVGIATIQKAEGAEAGRGGQFTKDFADLELLIDKHSDSESRLTIGKVKESTKRLLGLTYAFEIWDNGVKIKNFREVKKCNVCHGTKWKKYGNTKVPCDDCRHIGYVDK